MATEPASHPLDDEIEDILGADPKLLARLQDAHQRYERGDLTLVEHAEVGRRLRALGVPLEDAGTGPTPDR